MRLMTVGLLYVWSIAVLVALPEGTAAQATSIRLLVPATRKQPAGPSGVAAHSTTDGCAADRHAPAGAGEISGWRETGQRAPDAGHHPRTGGRHHAVSGIHREPIESVAAPSRAAHPAHGLAAEQRSDLGRACCGGTTRRPDGRRNPPRGGGPQGPELNHSRRPPRPAGYSGTRR